MKEYKFDVNFEKGKIRTNLKKLVQNDYNSTKINFTFDKEGRILFKMLLPDNTPYVTQIENDELVFGAGLLSKDGIYEVEIALYTENGRLTDYATVDFEVRAELIKTDDIIELDDRLPILDSLIRDINNINLDVFKEENKTTLIITKKDGSKQTVEVFDGKDGKNALINGRNVLEISAGSNISIEETENGIEINADETAYDDTEIRQQINIINEDLGNTEIKVQELENDIDNLEDNKAGKDEIPDVSEFVKKTVDNLVNYYKKTETYSQQEVNQLISAIKSIELEIVEQLPATGESNKIYLVPKTGEGQDVYNEFIWVNNKYELIGNTQVDLSNYYTKDEISTLLFDYITSNDLEEVLKDYATKADVTTITGDLENLSTEAKDNLVNAINEVASNSGGGVSVFKERNFQPTEQPTGIYFMSDNTSTVEGSSGSASIRAGTLYVIANDDEYQSKLAFEVTNSEIRAIEGRIKALSGSINKNFYVRFNNFLQPGTAASIYSVYTFSRTPKCTTDPTEDTHLTNKKYVDNAIATAITDVLGGSY